MTAFTTVPFFACPSGAASFTAAVMMSPSPAFNPVEPPSGRIICSLRAPELSATSSIDLIITAMASTSLIPASPLLHHGFCNFRNQRGLAHNVFQLPALQLRQRTRLLNPHHVAHMRLVGLVMSVELFVARDHAPVKWMRLLPRHLHHNGLAHAAGDHFSHHFLAPPLHFRRGFDICLGVRHYRFSITSSRLLLHARGRARALSGDRLHSRNVLAQSANLLQALGLPHVQLKLQLEELVGQFAFLMLQLFFGKISNLVCLHK